MDHKLEMPLEQFAEAVAKENERLSSEIERLHGIIINLTNQIKFLTDPLDWSENYGQGSEPWLKDDEK